MNTIVVGVDGSLPSLAALRYAIREARVHGSVVEAVAVWRVPSAAYGGGFAPGPPDPADFERAAQDALTRSLAAAADEADGVEVRGVVKEGDPAHVLVAEAEGAEQLVVGARSLGFVGRLLHHSVSGECAHGARCPVTIVHGG